MATIKFKWNPECLIPETIDIDLPIGKEGKVETVTFYELSKRKCDLFIQDCGNPDIKIYVETTDLDDTGKTVKKRLPFTEAAKQPSELINKWLAECTHNKYTAGDFTKLEDVISPILYGRLTEMLFGINHFDEIAATGGNYLMLPMVFTVNQEVVEAVTTN